MDGATGLVQAYLQSNGYFTQVEVPVVREQQGGFAPVTDLDIVGVRLPGARRMLLGRQRELRDLGSPPHDLLEVKDDRVDLIIGEIKEGAATLNEAILDRGVLAYALLRLGGLEMDSLEGIVDDLIAHGVSEPTPMLRVRLMAFGSKVDPELPRHIKTIRLGEILDYFENELEALGGLRGVQFKQPAIAFLMTLFKARGRF